MYCTMYGEIGSVIIGNQATTMFSITPIIKGPKTIFIYERRQENSTIGKRGKDFTELKLLGQVAHQYTS